MYALQAETLLRLQRHQEAHASYKKIPKFCIESYTKLFGLAAGTDLLMIRAQVDIAAGRLVNCFYKLYSIFDFTRKDKMLFSANNGAYWKKKLINIRKQGSLASTFCVLSHMMY